MQAQILTGQIPNIYWNAVSTERLRQEPQYTALPPVEDIAIGGIDSYRMVRQESQLWGDLHQGVLTTGVLNASLGFYEPKAAKRLGIGSSFVSHRALIRAYHRLAEEIYLPPRQSAKDLAYSDTAADQGSIANPKCPLPNQTGHLEARQRLCRSVASKGQQSVRMAWGTAQEGASLYNLLHALPRSKLLEAGLFQIDPGSLPKAWGFRPGDLPPLGASPDGLLWHPEGPCQRWDVVGAQQDSLSLNQAPGEGMLPAGGLSGDIADPGMVGVLQDPAILQIGLPVASAHVATAAATSSQISRSGRGVVTDVPVGDWMAGLLSADQTASKVGKRRKRKSHKSGVIQRSVQHSTAACTDNGIEGLLERLELSQTASNSGGSDHPLSAAGWRHTRSNGSVEVVEVKNSCPFRHSSQPGFYMIGDRGPASQVPAFWIPQLQMEMLAADAASAIVLSRSATKGLSLFRVHRDDEFLRHMLVIIRRFYSTYVKQRRHPPKDMFFDQSDYQVLINRVLAISRGASLLARIPSPKLISGADSRAFLD